MKKKNKLPWTYFQTKAQHGYTYIVPLKVEEPRTVFIVEEHEANEIFEAIKSVVKRKNFTKKCEDLWKKWNPKK